MEEVINSRIIQVTECIQLKPLETSDAEDIFNTIDSQREYLGQWLPFVKHTKKMEHTRDFIHFITNHQPLSLDHTFVIRYNGAFVGLIGYKGTDIINRKTEIGYWLSEKFQKKGIVTQSVKALISYAFNHMDMNRVQIKCATGNTPSKNIPKRLDFRFEGIERDGEQLDDDIFTDLEVYSKLKND
ncbi:MAG: GNAT family N-acetyltransferase [Bacteroidales bacterium]|nr:GNAT family N-acetyltransferase [Bacteroidales bacterium]